MHHNEHTEAYNQYQSTPHKAHLSHEVIGGAAAYEAMKAYNDHVERNGQPASHAKAKEIMAGLAGAFVTRMVETKGADAWDAHKAKQANEHAVEQSNRYVDRTFGN
ncbi:hypothetical protein SCLCIDRAFT_1222779 [Scleroderma citrinum Foug A]|uniref:Uncharacterized protein n=1 Tax=Scleroderma citrinum Foug A TaxID=1036808 RepID=A0A0C3CY05_9AGAM|nr:hypothetical protein SCLCIDRAFT_1222779 [Scleroderma citrinum Foug A]